MGLRGDPLGVGSAPRQRSWRGAAGGGRGIRQIARLRGRSSRHLRVPGEALLRSPRLSTIRHARWLSAGIPTLPSCQASRGGLTAHYHSARRIPATSPRSASNSQRRKHPPVAKKPNYDFEKRKKELDRKKKK